MKFTSLTVFNDHLYALDEFGQVWRMFIPQDREAYLGQVFYSDRSISEWAWEKVPMLEKREAPKSEGPYR